MRKFALLFTIVLSLGCLQSAKAESAKGLFMGSLSWPPMINIITKIFFRGTNQPIVQRTTGIIVSALVAGTGMTLAARQGEIEKKESTDKPLPSYNPVAFAGGAFVGAIIFTLTDFGIDLSLAGARKIGLISEK